MSAKQTLVMYARPTDGEGASPEIGVCTDAADLLGRVRQLCDLMEAHKLSEVRVIDSPMWGPDPSIYGLDLSCGELVVVSNGFYFTDSPSKEDYDIQTDLMSLNQLEELVNSGAEVIYGTQGLVDAYAWFLEEQKNASSGRGDTWAS